LLFAFGFYFELWLEFLLWAFWCELLEGKRIAKGNLLKGD
jgi:hypothetical protein